MSGRCCACNFILTPFEITRKYEGSGEYVGLCTPCLKTVPDFPDVVERNDLRRVDDLEDIEDGIELGNGISEVGNAAQGNGETTDE